VSETLETLRRKIRGAGELESVVRTMKAMAAASIGSFERAVRALGDYDRTVGLGLAAAFRSGAPPALPDAGRRNADLIGVVVFGSDQGLVGQFNDALADFVVRTLRPKRGRPRIWAVGERIAGGLKDAGLPVAKLFPLPNSVTAITPLVGNILLEWERLSLRSELAEVSVFHNRPGTGSSYQPVTRRLFPFDQRWRAEIARTPWPTKNPPEILGEPGQTLSALLREYLFLSLFEACAESLAAENSSRLAAMQRAEDNIEELKEDLGRTFHRVRQSSIDEELFEVVAGYESLRATFAAARRPQIPGRQDERE
jgi:F-type H+-transporting ATPase subunit gamma